MSESYYCCDMTACISCDSEAAFTTCITYLFLPEYPLHLPPCALPPSQPPSLPPSVPPPLPLPPSPPPPGDELRAHRWTLSRAMAQAWADALRVDLTHMDGDREGEGDGNAASSGGGRGGAGGGKGLSAVQSWGSLEGAVRSAGESVPRFGNAMAGLGFGGSVSERRGAEGRKALSELAECEAIHTLTLGPKLGGLTTHLLALRISATNEVSGWTGARWIRTRVSRFNAPGIKEVSGLMSSARYTGLLIPCIRCLQVPAVLIASAVSFTSLPPSAFAPLPITCLLPSSPSPLPVCCLRPPSPPCRATRQASLHGSHLRSYTTLHSLFLSTFILILRFPVAQVSHSACSHF